mmetsp:Transcript_4122/g.14555  ORF Transcript_4122/g.14555 Transcript_4122/m.14555 type:complete len:282 (+) Transcript_4122:82-927(+)
MAQSFLHIATGQPTVSCKVHPVVVMTILDHYVRREDSQKRVIGTLLGYEADGVVQIRSCFPVPHSEEGEIAVEGEYLRSMLELHSRANPRERIVGWYSSDGEINENSVLIHNFFWAEMEAPPVHLTVDTTLGGGNLSIVAYTSTPIGLNIEQALGQEFQPIAYGVDKSATDPAALRCLLRAREEPMPVEPDMVNLRASLQQLLDLLNVISDYIEKVTSGKAEPDNKVGKFLVNALSTLPKVDPTTFDSLFSRSLEDLLTATYLANLTRTQLQLAEKLVSQA